MTELQKRVRILIIKKRITPVRDGNSFLKSPIFFLSAGLKNE